MGSREVRGSAFVGRDEELRFLEAELADASAGRGRLVAIAGDPGIGKTRVVEEFIARAALPTGRVVPALRRHVSGREDGAPAVESDEWRFRLFDAVTSFLRRVTDRVPLVMVLD